MSNKELALEFFHQLSSKFTNNNLVIQDILCDCYEPGEQYLHADFDEKFLIEGADIYLKVKWNSYGDMFSDMDGFRFVENVGHDIEDVSFCINKNEFDITKEKGVLETVMKLIEELEL